jgi:hypothetical protein
MIYILNYNANAAHNKNNLGKPLIFAIVYYSSPLLKMGGVPHYWLEMGLGRKEFSSNLD